MSAETKAVFRGAYPIGDTDTRALPVKDVASAIGYYTQVLGFALESRDGDRATLVRDEARIGLERNDVDPDNASCYFEVSDVEGLRAEYLARCIEPTEIRVDGDGDEKHRLFFCKEPYGVCFCFGQKV